MLSVRSVVQMAMLRVIIVQQPSQGGHCCHCQRSSRRKDLEFVANGSNIRAYWVEDASVEHLSALDWQVMSQPSCLNKLLGQWEPHTHTLGTKHM